MYTHLRKDARLRRQRHGYLTADSRRATAHTKCGCKLIRDFSVLCKRAQAAIEYLARGPSITNCIN